MTRIAVSILFATVFWLTSAGISNATLIVRAGGLVYDDVLDITWLQDANYAQTTGYDEDLDDVREKLSYDLAYLENKNSLKMNFSIILKTVMVVLTGQGH